MSQVSKAFLAAECVRLGNENTVQALALSDLCNGAVKWFGSSPAYSLGISRPTGAAGGIVICRVNGGAGAFYWAEFAPRELAHISACLTGADTEYNRDLLRRRTALEAAGAYVAEQMRAA